MSRADRAAILAGPTTCFLQGLRLSIRFLIKATRSFSTMQWNRSLRTFSSPLIRSTFGTSQFTPKKEDSWFASVYDIAQAAHHAWTVFEQMWHGAPVVHAQVGLNGQPTDVRLFGVKYPTVEDVARVVAERYDQSSETLVVVATRCGACTGTVCESTTPLSVLNISQCVRLIPRLEPR